MEDCYGELITCVQQMIAELKPLELSVRQPTKTQERIIGLR